LKAIIYPEYLQAVRGKSFSPAAFLSWLNERMNFELRRSSGIIVTFLAALLDVQEGTLTYANAGQTHPFIVADGKARELPVAGTGLGFAASVSYVDRVERMGPGDLLVAYTDGLVEMRAASGECVQLAPRDLISGVAYGPDFHKRLLDAALAGGGRKDFDDDVTILTARLL